MAARACVRVRRTPMGSEPPGGEIHWYCDQDETRMLEDVWDGLPAIRALDRPPQEFIALLERTARRLGTGPDRAGQLGRKIETLIAQLRAYEDRIEIRVHEGWPAPVSEGDHGAAAPPLW